MVSTYNIKVALMDSDFYALQAIYSYLAWDRRTRIVSMAMIPQNLEKKLGEAAPGEQPDVTLFEVDWACDGDELRAALERLKGKAGVILCTSSRANYPLIVAAYEAGAKGYLVKRDTQLGIAGAIVIAIEQDKFVITPAVVQRFGDQTTGVVANAYVIPGIRTYPELTDRIAQALRLCVVEGMSAELAADEMGVSVHTIRSYVREGYRILEAHDDTEYPTDMSPQERAFMRFTALQIVQKGE
ncbi:MAG: response regulator transcription factor [Anaerolineae bacterium]|nr:response regulator transcription factor [Anaerolineae bacterium]